MELDRRLGFWSALRRTYVTTDDRQHLHQLVAPPEFDLTDLLNTDPSIQQCDDVTFVNLITRSATALVRIPERWSDTEVPPTVNVAARAENLIYLICARASSSKYRALIHGDADLEATDASEALLKHRRRLRGRNVKEGTRGHVLAYFLVAKFRLALDRSRKQHRIPVEVPIEGQDLTAFDPTESFPHETTGGVEGYRSDPELRLQLPGSESPEKLASDNATVAPSWSPPTGRVWSALFREGPTPFFWPSQVDSRQLYEFLREPQDGLNRDPETAVLQFEAMWKVIHEQLPRRREQYVHLLARKLAGFYGCDEPTPLPDAPPTNDARNQRDTRLRRGLEKELENAANSGRWELELKRGVVVCLDLCFRFQQRQ